MPSGLLVVDSISTQSAPGVYLQANSTDREWQILCADVPPELVTKYAIQYGGKAEELPLIDGKKTGLYWSISPRGVAWLP